MLHTVSAKHGYAQICTNQHFYNTCHIMSLEEVDGGGVTARQTSQRPLLEMCLS